MTVWIPIAAGAAIAWWLAGRRALRFATAAQRRALRRRQRGLCARCGRPLGQGAEAHHVVPFSRGGRTKLRNMVLLDSSCHSIVTAEQAARFGWHGRGPS